MLEDAIREVRVRVRTDLSSDAAEIRPAVEKVVRAVLERCARLLEQRAPGRVVLISRLPLRWRFDELDEFANSESEHIDELAHSTADVIERLALAASRGASLLTQSTVPDVMFFDDEAHLRASQLLALAQGRRDWFDAVARIADEGDPWAALARPDHRVMAEATLRRLAREGALASVLAAGDTADVAAVAAVLDIEAVPSIGSIGKPTTATRSGGLTETLDDIASSWPALPLPARRVALRVHAAELLERDLDADDVAALAGAVESVSARTDRRTDDKASREGSHARQPTEQPALESQPEEATGRTFVTGTAGLFYLLARLQELDIPESLWKACLPEGDVLAAAAAALLGPAFKDDPAPALFGGIEGVVPCPEVTYEQHAEVARATCAQMAAALPRRGGAGIPGAVVTLADRASGRVLIAAVEGLPFAFFAWPAQAPELVREGLATLLDLWPSSAPLTASPALTMLDPSGRLQPWHQAPITTDLVPEASSSPAAALLAMAAGAPATLLAWRAGDAAVDGTEAFVARRLARSARVRVTVDRMDVILRGADVDLDLRRAALDSDPGWLPWLRRSVRFVFEGLEVVEEP